MPVSNKPFAWSFSKLDGFETCPRRLKFVDILKTFQEGPSPARDFGSDLHKALEDTCRSEGETPIPAKFKEYEDIAGKVLRLGGRKSYELKLAIDEQGQPCAYFDRQAWYRGVIDVAAIKGSAAVILDYKTGKRDPKGGAQLEMHAYCLMAHYPRIDKVEARYWWITKGRAFDTFHYERQNMPAMLAKYLPRVDRFKRAYEADTFPAKPSGLCRGYCPVTTCPHHQPKFG